MKVSIFISVVASNPVMIIAQVEENLTVSSKIISIGLNLRTVFAFDVIEKYTA